MKISNVYQLQKIASGINRLSPDVSAENVLALAQELHDNQQELDTFTACRLSRHLVIDEGEGKLIINFTEAGPEQFKAIHRNPSIQAAVNRAVGGYNADSLRAFLGDYGHTALSGVNKPEMIERVLKSPELSYKAVSVNTADVPNFMGARRIDMPTGQICYFPKHMNVRHAFWQLFNGSYYGFDLRTPARDLDGRTKSIVTRLQLQPATATLPPIPLPEASWDITALKIDEIAAKYGTKLTNTKEGTIRNVVSGLADKKAAERLAGKTVYFSLNRPIVLGTPLNEKRMLAIADSIQVVTSVNGIFQGVIAPEKKRVDFETYFLQSLRVWATLAEVSL